MSKFIDHLEIRENSERLIKEPNAFSCFKPETSFIKSQEHLPPFGVRYTLSVRLGTNVVIFDEDLDKNKYEVLNKVVNRMKRHLAEEVFGEFSPALREIYHEAARIGNRKIMDLVYDMQDKMFRV